MLHEKIDKLKHDIIAYAHFVENMLVKSMDGLITHNKEELNKVIKLDEPIANEKELLIDNMCMTLIAQYEPKAVDLRNILMILKINNDLERIGDHAVNISESALYLIKHTPVKPPVDLPGMLEIVISMLNRCVVSFLKKNTEEAEAVCLEDDKVDQLRDQILRELITYMGEDTSAIKQSIHLLRISSNLERSADLVTNICEDIIFTVEGRVAKHRHTETTK